MCLCACTWAAGNFAALANSFEFFFFFFYFCQTLHVIHKKTKTKKTDCQITTVILCFRVLATFCMYLKGSLTEVVDTVHIWLASWLTWRKTAKMHNSIHLLTQLPIRSSCCQPAVNILLAKQEICRQWWHSHVHEAGRNFNTITVFLHRS